MGGITAVPGTDSSFRVVLDRLDGGWSTRSFPHLIADNELYVADNVVFARDGLVSKRPGNVNYGGGNGKTGSTSRGLAGTRFYYGNPITAKLIVHSGTQLWKGTDGTGAFTSVMTGVSAVNPATFAQMYDPDAAAGAGATALFVCDGIRIPQIYDSAGNAYGVNTAAGFLPTGLGGATIKPSYVAVWNGHLVYAGDPSDPGALWISDAFRPQRFTGYNLVDSAGTQYTPYYPGERNSQLGPITGLAVLGNALIVFFSNGVVAAINTGTYGAFQYEFFRLSSSIGAYAPRSIQSFDTFIVFFGGDRFYATDGQTVTPIPDRVPTVYANTAQSTFPSEMLTKNTVCSVRRGQQYMASYDVTGNGIPTRIAVFDFSANGGWSYGAPSGGAWSRFPSGMPLAWGVECRGPGDSQQMFWGSSQADLVAQFDTGLYSDFGLAIPCEVRAKSLFLDKPIWPKTVHSVYPMLAYATQGAQYTSTIIPYIQIDGFTDVGPALNETVNPSGTPYGAAAYGTFNYGASQQIVQLSPKGYPAQPTECLSFAPGVTESSTAPFNIIGFVCEVTIDEPTP